MTNLLPAEVIKKRRSRVVMNVLLTFGGLCSLMALVLTLSVLPAYLQAYTEKKGFEAYAATQEGVRATAQRAERDALVSAKKRSAALIAIAHEGSFSQAITAAIERRVKGIGITSFSYSHKDGGSTLSLTGVTPGRQTLQEYVRTLEAEPLFEKVDIPISALTRTEEGTFDVLITGTF